MTQPHHLKLKAFLVVFATFALGTITGAALSGMFLQVSTNAHDSRGRPDMPVLDSLRRELNLTDAQAAAIRAVTAETRRDLRDVRLERCPGFTDARRHLVGRVRALLTPQQQQHFDAVVSQRQMRSDSSPGVERGER